MKPNTITTNNKAPASKQLINQTITTTDRPNNSPILRFPDSQILQFSDSPILTFSNSQILQFSDSPILKFSDCPILRFSNCQILQFSSSPTATQGVMQATIDWFQPVGPGWQLQFHVAGAQTCRFEGGAPGYYSHLRSACSYLPILRFSDSPILQFSDSPILRFSDSQSLKNFRFSDSQILKLVFKFSDSRNLRFSDSQRVKM